MRRSRQSVGRRVLATSLAWLCLGCIIGLIEGLGEGGGVQIFTMMLGGMTVLPTIGALLGLIGGDAIGSVTGAAGGLLGCLAADLGCGLPIQPHLLSVLVVFCALLGATSFLFLQFLVWKYRMIFRTICWSIGFKPPAEGAWSIAGRLLGLNSREDIPVPWEKGPNADHAP